MENQKNKKKKRVLLIIGSMFLLILLSIGVTLFVTYKNKADKDMQPPEIGSKNEGIISASGLTAVGMTEEICKIDFLETSLYVEEAYLSVGEEIKEGTAICKISDVSLKESLEELNTAVTETGLAYRQGRVDYETGILEAEGIWKTAQVNQTYAQAEYESAAAEAAKAVEGLKEQIEEARELASDYSESANNDYYYTYYQVKELQDIYYENFTYLMELYESWDIEKLEDIYGQVSLSTSSSNGSSAPQDAGQEGQSAQGGQSGQGSQGGASSATGDSEKLAVYNYYDELVKSQGEAYAEAKEKYETSRINASAGLDKANSNLEQLNAELIEAETLYEQELVKCTADYDTTLAESKNAEMVYETTLQRLEDTLSDLQSKKEEAEENLSLFRETAGDGYFYTKNAGTIVMNNVREGNYLSGESILAAYSNEDTVTVAANVNQDDIASVSVGDNAYAVIEEYGSYNGTVTSVNPISQAQSRSAVTYQVTVNLEGDISGLESNLTAYVYFGNNLPEQQDDKRKQEELRNEGTTQNK